MPLNKIPPVLSFILIPILAWLASYLSKAVDPSVPAPPITNLLYGLPLAGIIGFLVWSMSDTPEKIDGIYSSLLVMIGYTQHWGLQKFKQVLKSWAEELFNKVSPKK